MNFRDKLDAAGKAENRTEIVTVSLDADVAARRNDLLGRIEGAKKPVNDARLAKGNGAAKLEAELEALEAEFAHTLIEVVCPRAPGDDWAQYAIKNPMREDVAADRAVGGYNVSACIRAALLEHGGVLEDGQVEKLTSQDWDDLFQALSGFEVQEINDTVFHLNVGGPAQAIDLAKKALAAILSSEQTSEQPPASA